MLPSPELLRQIIQQLSLEISYSWHSAAGATTASRRRSREEILGQLKMISHYSLLLTKVQWKQNSPSSCSCHYQPQQLQNCRCGWQCHSLTNQVLLSLGLFQQQQSNRNNFHRHLPFPELLSLDISCSFQRQPRQLHKCSGSWHYQPRQLHQCSCS